MKKLITLTTIILFSGCSQLTAPEFDSPIKKVAEDMEIVDQLEIPYFDPANGSAKYFIPTKDSTQQCYKIIPILEVDSLKPFYPKNIFIQCWKRLPVIEIDSIAFFNQRHGVKK
jgi:hypothetical protein